MIGRLRGIILEKQPPLVLLETAGVGYEVHMPMTCFYELPEAGQEAIVFTHFVVREDAQLLYGFNNKQERTLFKELIKTNGVGPKLAQRIVLEMKDKVDSLSAAAGLSMEDLPATGVVSAAGNAAEAVSALTVLGFSASEASAVVGKLDSALPVEQLVREALKQLATRA